MCLINIKPSMVSSTIGYKVMRSLYPKIEKNHKEYMALHSFYPHNEVATIQYKMFKTYISGYFLEGREEIKYTPGFHAYDSFKSAQKLEELFSHMDYLYAPSVIVKVLLEEIHTEGYDKTNKLCYVGNKQTIIEEM